jgi:OmcA/MtrC family decaheme c-type cytochrome
MRGWRVAAGAGTLAAAMTLGLASCGDDDNNGGAAAPPQVEPDRMRLEILSAAVPDPTAAGTATSGRPTVRFRVLDEKGAVVNLESEMATTTTLPNTTGPRFTLAQLDPDGNYTSYYSTTAQPKDYTFDGPKPTPAPRTQATSPPVTAADLKNVGSGVYEYTFPPANVSSTDRAKTHTVGGWIARNLQNGDTTSAGGALDFIPAGTGAVQHEQVVSNEACNRCHGQLTAHGSRRNVQLCITCHSPQTGDPETNRTVDFKVMIHKLHSGATLPSVRRGEPYFIVGFRQAVVDFSEVEFPWHEHGVTHCTVCHSGGEDAANWKNRPSLTACTSCHDNVKFASAAGLDPCPIGTQAATNTKDCLHAGGPIAVANANAPTDCLGCHGPNAAQSVDKFHHGD